MLAVAVLVALALAATFLLEPLRDWLRPAPVLSPTPFDWSARIEAFAGDGHRGLRDGHLLQARFDEPWGLVRGADGALYVSEGGSGNRIRRIAADGTVSTFAGTGAGFADGIGTAAAFDTPSSLAVDLLGTLYVADTGNHAIRKVSPQGAVTTLAGTGIAGFRDGDAAQAQFRGPMGVAVDAVGRVYVADTWNDRIRVIEPDGRVRTLAGGDRPGFADGTGEAARFDTPTALAVANDGTVWVADTGNRALRAIDANGTVRTWQADPLDAAAAMLARPLALAVTHDGQLYVADTFNNRVVRMSQTDDGELSTPELYASGLGFADGIAFDEKGDLFVASAGQVWVVLGSNDPLVQPFVTSGDLNGPASLAFGFGTGRDRSRLYFTNYGYPVLGSGTSVASVKVGISGARLFAP